MPIITTDCPECWNLKTFYQGLQSPNFLLICIRMTLTNFDASQIAMKKRQKALFAWKSANDSLVNAGRSVLSEQPSYQSAEDVAMRRQGGCKCTTDALANPYEFNGLSQCGCGAAQ
jgi:hypothetical protein